jgi:hypothetical protein
MRGRDAATANDRRRLLGFARQAAGSGGFAGTLLLRCHHNIAQAEREETQQEASDSFKESFDLIHALFSLFVD